MSNQVNPLVAPGISQDCERGRHERCPGRSMAGARFLNVCVCRCHLSAREGGDIDVVLPADPLTQVVGAAPDPAFQRCPRCNWPGDVPKPTSTEVEHDRKSRQQAKRREKGMCIQCGKVPPSDGSARCANCREHRREYYKTLTGSVGWHPGGPGRPPLDKRNG